MHYLELDHLVTSDVAVKYSTSCRQQERDLSASGAACPPQGQCALDNVAITWPQFQKHGEWHGYKLR